MAQTELSLRAYTGTNAGTESAAQTAILLVDADALTGGSVVPGSNSFERWLRLKVDTIEGAVTGFWFQNAGTLPAGVTLKFGTTDDPATPTDAESTVATMTLEAGRRYIWDVSTLDEVGATTKYLVIQAQVSPDADSGAIPQQTPSFGWSES